MKKILILSGEGVEGTFTEYQGRGTLRALRRAYKKEISGGDRWCKFFIFSPEDGCYAVFNPIKGEFTGELRDISL